MQNKTPGTKEILMGKEPVCRPQIVLNLIQGDNAQKIRLDTKWPALLSGKENEVYLQDKRGRTFFDTLGVL